MSCLKCAGFLVEERIVDFFITCTVWRCLTCGAVLDAQTYRNRLASQAKGIEMPKFLSEESKQQWVESVRRSKAAKKQRQNEALQQDEDGDNLPIVVEPDAVPADAARARHRRTAVIDHLNLAICALEKDRAVLEQAKEILSR